MKVFYVGGEVEMHVEAIAGVGTGSTLSSYEIFRQRKNEREFPIMSERINGNVQSHFLDSGAFTLWTRAAKWAQENKKGKWDFYETDEFFEYMDAYATFVKKHHKAIDFYANVDAIPNGKITWRNQRYLERKHGLNPVPVVHLAPDSLMWLRRYIDKGYEFIGLGGLAGKASRESRRRWLDRCFSCVCDNPKRLPCVKLHGFGVTSFPLVTRYPWWSVDSVTWAKVAGFGGVLVPHKRKGKFVFDIAPYVIKMSMESDEAKKLGKHFKTLRAAERVIIEEWLDEIGIPLGRENGGEVVEHGVLTRHTERRAANLHFFERLRASLPEWPWPFKGTVENRLGV